MSYELINEILLVGGYLVYTIWAILIVVLFTALFKRNWILVKRTIKYALNSLVFIIAWMFIIELALIVRPTFYKTKEASAIALKLWIERHQINDIYIALSVVAFLSVINLLFHFKVEKRRYYKDLFILTVFNTIVLVAGIWLTGQYAYYGLMQEINRHFG